MKFKVSVKINKQGTISVKINGLLHFAALQPLSSIVSYKEFVNGNWLYKTDIFCGKSCTTLVYDSFRKWQKVLNKIEIAFHNYQNQ